LAQLSCVHNILTDLSPLSGMTLKNLICAGCPNLSDLSPLAGMPLIYLNCQGLPISDLSPLRRMPLSNLVIISTQVSDLSPLRGMPLTDLRCDHTQVTDLSPLEGMKLVRMTLTPKNINKGLDVIHQIKTLTTIGTTTTEALSADEFWKKYDAGEFGKPAIAKPITSINDPAFQQWLKATQALPAEKQIEALSKKLMELNPGFDGKLSSWDGKSTPKIVGGLVTELGLHSANVTDISPVRALAGLVSLECSADGQKSRMADLSPLKGMKLTRLAVSSTAVSDLSPLRAMPLRQLYCYNTQVTDLAPLNECGRLVALTVTRTKVTAAGVAALQNALPNCKIQWDDPTKPKTP
jgi:Leucine-rich repeat (LRR) protein